MAANLTVQHMLRAQPLLLRLALPTLLLPATPDALATPDVAAAPAAVHIFVPADEGSSSSSGGGSSSSVPPASSDRSMPDSTFSVGLSDRALLIDGEPRFLASGGFHYPRASPGSWRAIMRAMKANGLNTITTYAFWELHERRRGVYDWGQIRPEANVSAWLALAHEEGLWVHMRIGPYINGNWQAGGFPAWLREIPGIEYRTDNEPFKKEMQRWFDDFVEYVRPWLHAGDTGGPIISVQVENEYSYSSTADMRYIDWCEQPLFAAILYQNDPFTKTGSGQT